MLLHRRGVWLVLGVLGAPLACGNVHNLASRANGGTGSTMAGEAGEGPGGMAVSSAGVANDAGATAEAGANAEAGAGGEGGTGAVTCEPECGVGATCVAGECRQCSQLLEPPLDYADLPGSTGTVAVADFDGDGRDDLAYSYANEVRFELGSNTGLELQPGLQFSSASTPMIATHADFDRDGHADLLVKTGEDLEIVWGGAAVPFERTSAPLDGLVTVADFNADDWPDLARYPGASEQGEITIAWGRPGRVFEAGPTSVGMPSATRAVAADFDHDGKLDLTLAAPDALQAFTGDGAGNFTAKTRNEMPGLRDFTLHDLDDDGKLDLIMSLGTGDGQKPWLAGYVGVYHDYRGFLFAGTVTYDAGNAGTLLVSDVDGDDRLDIVATNTRNNAADVLLGRGDGAFDKRRAYALGPYPSSIALGDLNGDGLPDIAAAGNGRSVAYNRGDGSFGQRVYPTLSFPERLLLQDVTGDGHPDALVTSYWGNNLLLLAGTPSGELLEPERISNDPDNVGGYSSPVVVADFDGDGQPEIAMFRQKTLTVYRRTPALRFEVLSATPWSGYMTSLALGDLNEDGKLDAVATEGYSGTAQIRLGSGDGEFGASTTLSVGEWPSRMLLTDMNHDQHLDLVLAIFSDKQVSIRLGSGDGELGEATSVEVSGQPLGLEQLDLNSDGWPDVVTTYRGSIGVLLADGSGGLLPEVVYESAGPQNNSGNGGPAVTFADFDGDGRLDIATLDESSSTFPEHSRLVVLAGRGDGSLLDPVRYPVAINPQAIASADLNGDETPDVVVLSRFGASLTVFANQAVCGK
jgi:hypothetical protein